MQSSDNGKKNTRFSFGGIGEEGDPERIMVSFPRFTRECDTSGEEGILPTGSSGQSEREDELYRQYLESDDRLDGSPAFSISEFLSLDQDCNRSVSILPRKQCLRCDVVDSFARRFDGRSVLCSSVLYSKQEKQFPRLRDALLEEVNEQITGKRIEKLKSNDWIIATHFMSDTSGRDRSHVHLVHFCRTFDDSHRCCRCAVDNGFRAIGFDVKREYHRLPRRQHIEEMFVYLQKDERRITEVYIAGKPQTWECGNEVFDIKTCKCGQIPSDGTGYIEPNTSDFGGICLGEQPIQKRKREDDEVPGGDNKRQQGGVSKLEWLGTQASEKILKWFPMSQNEFKNDKRFKSTFPELYWSKELWNKVIPTAWDDAVRDWNNMTLQEIAKKRWQTPKTFLTYQKHYYAPLYSTLLIARLLLEQYNNVNEAIKFIDDLVTVFNKVDPKRNTLCMISEPSAGKSFIIHSLLELSWSVGRFRNPKKGGDSFCFEDGMNRRCIEWNECILEGKEFVETSKMIWEGVPATVNVKFKSNQVLTRTPIFVTANHMPWNFCPNEKKAFMDRCFYHHWTSQPWLKEVACYPTPMAWRILLDNYKDEEWWREIPDVEYFQDKLKDTIIDPDNVYLDLWIYCKEKEKTKENDYNEIYNSLLKDCILHSNVKE